jgi:predicted nucleotidyltransferase
VSSPPPVPTFQADIQNQLELAHGALIAARQQAEAGSKLMCAMLVGLSACHVARAAIYALGVFEWKEERLDRVFDEQVASIAGPEMTMVFHELTDARKRALLEEPTWEKQDIESFLGECQQLIAWGERFVAEHPAQRHIPQPVRTGRKFTDLSLGTQKFLLGLRNAIREKEDDAQLILFGSRARQEETPESDWDLLVLLPGPVNEQRRKALRVHLYTHSVLKAAANRNAAIRSKLAWQIMSKQDWETSPVKDGSLHWNVTAFGIEV